MTKQIFQQSINYIKNLKAGGRLTSCLVSASDQTLTRMIFVLAWSITCYRCGGTAASCKSSGSATVECDDPSHPNLVFACRVYTVNYTSLNNVLEFKSKKKNIISEPFSTLKTPPVGLEEGHVWEQNAM